MKILTCADAISFTEARTTRGTCGVYGLIGADNKVRYIGSSVSIEHRLYAHTHSSGKRTPKGRWVLQSRSKRLPIRAVVLEEIDRELATREYLEAAERKWLGIYHLVGEADLNVRLTPVDHKNSKGSPGKILKAENIALREQVKKNSRRKSHVYAQHCNTMQHVANTLQCKSCNQRNTPL